MFGTHFEIRQIPKKKLQSKIEEEGKEVVKYLNLITKLKRYKTKLFYPNFWKIWSYKKSWFVFCIVFANTRHPNNLSQIL